MDRGCASQTGERDLLWERKDKHPYKVPPSQPAWMSGPASQRAGRNILLYIHALQMWMLAVSSSTLTYTGLAGMFYKTCFAETA